MSCDTSFYQGGAHESSKKRTHTLHEGAALSLCDQDSIEFGSDIRILGPKAHHPLPKTKPALQPYLLRRPATTGRLSCRWRRLPISVASAAVAAAPITHKSQTIITGVPYRT